MNEFLISYVYKYVVHYLDIGYEMSTLNVLYSLLIFSVNITILKYKANKLFTNSFTFYSFIYNYSLFIIINIIQISQVKKKKELIS